MQKLKELRPELFRPVSALKDPHQNVVIKNIRRGNFDMPIKMVIPPTNPTKPTMQREPQLKIVVDSFSTPEDEDDEPQGQDKQGQYQSQEKQGQEQEQKQDEPIIQIQPDKQPKDAEQSDKDADIVQPEEGEDADIVGE